MYYFSRLEKWGVYDISSPEINPEFWQRLDEEIRKSLFRATPEFAQFTKGKVSSCNWIAKDTVMFPTELEPQFFVSNFEVTDIDHNGVVTIDAYFTMWFCCNGVKPGANIGVTFKAHCDGYTFYNTEAEFLTLRFDA